MNAIAAPQFHPDQFLLQDYVAGDVPGAVALTLAVHLEYCPRCRADAGDLSCLGGELLAELDPVPVEEEAFARLMQSVDARPSPLRPTAANAAAPDGLPRVLAALVPHGLGALDWNRFGRIRSTRLGFGDPRREVGFQHIAAGARVPEHDHRGHEITVVLKGSFSDRDGRYCAGDYLVRGPGEVHRPMVSDDDDCLCLAVLDAPLRFRGLFGLIANPFTRLRPA